MRADIRGLREQLRAAVIEADTNGDYARELHEAARESIVNGTDAYRARKSSSRQVAIFTGWIGAEHREEVTSDVGN